MPCSGMEITEKYCLSFGKVSTISILSGNGKFVHCWYSGHTALTLPEIAEFKWNFSFRIPCCVWLSGLWDSGSLDDDEVIDLNDPVYLSGQ